MPTSPPSSHDLDDYRIGAASEIEDLLRRMESERTLITISGPDGASYTTLLWGIDSPRGLISFSADGTDAALASLLECDELQAAAYLDRIKVQFDLEGLVHVRGGRIDVLNARLPREVFRFQRRSAFRVQPFNSPGPVAQFRHPAMPDMKVALRILDVSLSGVALFLPDNVPAIDAGVRLNQCTLKLDAETELEVALLIHHVTALQPEARGWRLGCEFASLDGQDRSLQHYINQTQKRRIVLAG